MSSSSSQIVNSSSSTSITNVHLLSGCEIHEVATCDASKCYKEPCGGECVRKKFEEYGTTICASRYVVNNIIAWCGCEIWNGDWLY